MFYRNALHVACWDDRLEIAKLLIEYNINWKKKAGWFDKTPLQVCEDRDAYNMIALLKSMEPTTDYLIFLIQNGFLDSAEKLIDSGFNLNVQDFSGRYSFKFM